MVMTAMSADGISPFNVRFLSLLLSPARTHNSSAYCARLVLILKGMAAGTLIGLIEVTPKHTQD